MSKIWVKISNLIRYSFKFDQNLRIFDRKKIFHSKTGGGGVWHNTRSPTLPRKTPWIWKKAQLQESSCKLLIVQVFPVFISDKILQVYILMFPKIKVFLTRLYQSHQSISTFILNFSETIHQIYNKVMFKNHVFCLIYTKITIPNQTILVSFWKITWNIHYNHSRKLGIFYFFVPQSK